MRKSREWLCALAVALGCAMSAQGFCEEVEASGAKQPAVTLASSTSWADEKPTNEPPAPPIDESPTPQPAPTTLTQQAAGNNCTPGCAPSCAAGCASCCNSGCSSMCCEDCCDCCCRPASLIASIESVFLFPQFHRDFLTASYFFPGGDGDLVTNSALGSTDGSLLIAPRITLGVQGEKWGLQFRYFNATNWATGGFLPALPDTGNVGFANVDDFRAYNTSLEVLRRGCIGAWEMYGMLGAQYGSLNNDRLLNVTTTGTLPLSAANVQTTAFSTQQFNGTGLTFGFWGSRPIACDSPFSLFLLNRYSVLWGQGVAATQTSAAVGIQATATDGALVSKLPGDMFIAELQLGLQWQAQLQCFPGTAFVRLGMEFQYWDTNCGFFTANESFAVGSDAGGITSATATDQLVSLIGFNLGAGIMF
jgi:hypothetical protein